MENPSPPAETAQNSSITGDLRLHEFTSRVFSNTRMLRIWLPPGYDETENEGRKYPVFYLNDGQNLFDRATAFAGVEWQVDETADRLIRENKVQPLIVVGIDNAQKERIREFLPYRSIYPPVLRPQGQKYLKFLLDEVAPFVRQRYRIASGPENTGLGGSSLGAVISLFTVMERPGIFGRLLLESPSLYISNRKPLKQSRAFRQWPQRIFLAVGTQETSNPGRSGEVVDDVRHLQRILQRAGLWDNRLRVRIDEGATHNEAAWAARFPEALEFLFGANPDRV